MPTRILVTTLTVAIAVTVIASGCSPRPRFSGPAIATEGLASYYGHEFHGRTTASGEIYDENKMTAAHRDLPFGTSVRVTNLANGRSVVVTVNDRGPFVAGRIIDLSYAAARQLDFLDQGVVRVRIETVP